MRAMAWMAMDMRRMGPVPCFDWVWGGLQGGGRLPVLFRGRRDQRCRGVSYVLRFTTAERRARGCAGTLPRQSRATRGVGQGREVAIVWGAET